MVLLVSELGKIMWRILNLLIEEGKTLLSYSVPTSPASPVQPQGSHRTKYSAFFSLFLFFLLSFLLFFFIFELETCH